MLAKRRLHAALFVAVLAASFEHPPRDTHVDLDVEGTPRRASGSRVVAVRSRDHGLLSASLHPKPALAAMLAAARRGGRLAGACREALQRPG